MKTLISKMARFLAALVLAGTAAAALAQTPTISTLAKTADATNATFLWNPGVTGTWAGFTFTTGAQSCTLTQISAKILGTTTTVPPVGLLFDGNTNSFATGSAMAVFGTNDTVTSTLSTINFYPGGTVTLAASHTYYFTLSVPLMGNPPGPGSYQWARTAGSNGADIDSGSGWTMPGSYVTKSFTPPPPDGSGTAWTTVSDFRLMAAVYTSLASAPAPIATLTSSGTTYSTGGGTLTFTAAVSFTQDPATVGAIGWTVNLPTGWASVSSTGPGGQPTGTTGALEWFYTDIPTSPATFTFVVAYPSGLSGNQTVTSSVVFRENGVRHDLTPAPLTFTMTSATNVAASITAQPTSQTVIQGQTATFSVMAAGYPAPTYQWKKGTTVLTDTGTISGSSSATLTITGAQTSDEGSYTVTVTNTTTQLNTVTSTAATLTVDYAPSITNPGSLTKVVGDTAAFSVVATGKPVPTLQWKKNGVAIASATNATYTITSVQSTDAGNYTVVASNGISPDATSAVATLTVGTPATITSQPTDQLVDAGQTATFTVTATGTATLTYQWKKAGTDIANATGTTLAITNAQVANEGSYTVVVSNGIGTAATSTAATLSIKTAPAIITQPQSQAVSAGASVTLTVVATGKPAPTYQWKKGSANISSATNAAYTIAAATTDDAGSYTVVVSNGINPAATSNIATLTVVPAGFTVTHTLVGSGYIAGGTVTISNTFTYSGELSSLNWNVLLPTGFKFVSSVDVGGPTPPQVNDIGTISWVWSSIPPSGSTFTYTLSVPADATGDKSLAAYAEFTIAANGQVVQMLAKPDPLVVSQMLYHTADTNSNWKIDVAELSRVITLYNARYTMPDGSGKIRTGCYKVASPGTTVDGYAPDTSLDGNTPAALTQYHSADTNHNGKIDVAELSRVITLYNARYTMPDGSGKIRTGYYKVASPGTTVDGYAPDPTQAPPPSP
jgi:hypothetical protein